MSREPLVTEEMVARQPLEAQSIIRLLRARIAEQDKRVAALEAEVAALKKTPRNSSLAPSTEHPHAKRAQARQNSRKKRGGQAGHPMHERSLIPIERREAAAILKPQEYRRCGTPLAGDDPEPLRHQVWEISEIKSIVTKYQRH